MIRTRRNGKVYEFPNIGVPGEPQGHDTLLIAYEVCTDYGFDFERVYVAIGDRTEAVAQLAAYYALRDDVYQLKWINVVEVTGFRNPTTPYSDQDPELYIKD